MNKFLYYLCSHAVNIMYGWRPVPAWIIAQQAGVTLYAARKELKKLKKSGLADTISVIIDPEVPLPYHGWTITKAAYETQEYKKAWQEEQQICRDIFGKDMFPEESEK